MIRARGVVKSLFLTCLLAVPITARAATTDFRVLFDRDNDAATGCTVAGMTGVDQIFLTRVEVGESAANVTGTFHQLCQGTNFGPLTPLETSLWHAGYETPSGNLLVETRIPFTAFAGDMPKMRIGIDARQGALSHVALGMPPEQTPVYFPAPARGRRRAAAAPGEDRMIVMDGLPNDWTGLKNKFENIGGTGTAGLRMLSLLGFVNTFDNHVYFMFRANVSTNTPFAQDDDYTRDVGAGLTVPGATGEPTVLANDSDPNGIPLKATLVSQPKAGEVVLDQTGGFTYTPDDPSSKSTDSFEYRASNGSLDSNVAKVKIKVEEVQVSGPNQAPSFTKGPNVTVLEDAGVHVVAEWAKNINAGEGEPDQHVTFVVTNVTNSSLFSQLPTIDATGWLSFRSANNRNGSATVTVKAKDDGGTADGGTDESAPQTFNIVVTAVNDAPTFTNGPNVVVLDTDGPQTVNGFVPAMSPGPSDESGQGLSFLVGTDSPSLFLVQPSIASNGQLTYTPAPGVDGIATVTVQLQDTGGTANGGDNTSAAKNFSLTVEKAPLITSADNTTFIAGQANTFTVTTTGRPKPSIAQGGTLPAGVTFVDGTGSNKGTGVLSGTPGPLTGGVYPLTFQATSPRGTSPLQNFTLTVNQAPSITSGNTATFTRNSFGTFTITALGFPTPAISLTGTLPAGLSFVDNGNGTATIDGTPTAAGGAYGGFTVTASNGVGTNATQGLTVVINEAPAITSASSTGFNAGVFAAFTVTTTGFPTPTLSETGALPSGITFTDNGNGTATLGGTAVQGSGGVYTITINATNVAGTAPQTFTITVCNTIAVTNPGTTTGTVGSVFSQDFTQTGAVGGATFATSSTLPAGLTLATNGTLSGTPTQFGTFPIVVTVTDANACTGTGSTYTLIVSCQGITVNNPANSSGTASSAFSETFTQSGALGGATFTTSSTLPAGLSLATNGTLSGVPTQTGTFPIVVTVTDGNGCTGVSATYNLVIGCQVINVTNPANSNGTAASAFSETFTQTGAIGTAVFTTSSTLPAGLSLATNGTLSGIPTQTGTFPIVVTVTDANTCTGLSATYTLVIGCQVINVTNPATTTGTVNAAFSQNFTQTGAIGTPVFTTSSTLPAGLTLATNGTLSGTPTVDGSFPIVVTVTDANTCTGTSAPYNLVIGCQTITVTNPANLNGTVSASFSETFTQTSAVGGATFTVNSGVLPAGLTLATNGVLSGTPTQAGSFPITVLVTDGNGCTGVSAPYNLVIGCQNITVTNPSNATGPAGSSFSETFTQTGAIGTATFTTSSTLPAGLTLAPNGVLSGTPGEGGTFPIVVVVTDSNSCTGTSAPYNLIITCPVINVTNPANANGTANSAFSETFTQTGAIGGATFTVNTGTLPTGLTLAANGVLSGMPTQTGSFPITVKVTDGNGCTGISATYTIVIGCQSISVTNPGNGGGIAGSAFSETFTQTGGIGTTNFTLATGTLPAGLTLAANGTLSGIPTQTGSFPITVTATDSNGCPGTGSTYTITIGCQSITVNNPANANGTILVGFNEVFTQTGAIGTPVFTVETGSLPAGLTLAANGTLSGTPTVTGSFPITVKVTDGNSCTGISGTYTIVISCQAITVNNPGVSTGTVNAAFSQTFTQTGANGGATFTLNSGTLPAGLTLASNGLLSGTPTQSGTFPITVLVTDGNSCTGVSATYNLVIGCQAITVTNPANANGVAGSSFSELFTQTGGFGTTNFTLASGTLPAGLSLAANGTLSGTPTQTGSFPITVTATDSNNCTGTSSTYTIVIACQTITVTNPGVTTGTVDTAFSQSFSQAGAIGTATFTVDSGTLPPGLTLDASGNLSGMPSAPGTYNFVVKVTDSNNCSGLGTTYTLIIACQVITVVNPANATGSGGVAFSEQFTATGIGTHGPAVFTLASGTLPAGLTLAPDGTLSGTPTQFGTFPITVTVTDANTCSATGSTYNLVIVCPTFVFTPANTMPAATYGVAYSQNISVTGGTGSYALTLANATNVPASFSFTDNGNGTATIASLNPTVTGVFTFDVNVLDTNSNCTQTQTFSFTVAPNAVNDTYSAAAGLTDSVGNTEAVAAGFSTPTTPYVTYAPSVLANDSAPGGTLTVVTPSVTNAAGTITFNAAGGWSYIPAAGFAGTATFPFTIASNGAQAASSVSIVVTNKVWYVRNNAGGGGTGLSTSPFNTLTAAETASAAGDYIYVHNGDNTTNNQNAGITLKDNQRLIGSGSALTVNGNSLAVAGTKPLIGHSNGNAVTLANGNTLNGFTATTTTGTGLAGIFGTGLTTGATIDNVDVTNAVTSGINLASSGTITTALSNVNITGAATGITGSTFGTLTIGTGVNVSGVSGLALTTGTVNGTFAAVNATGGTNGIALSGVAGTTTIASGTLTGATGDELLVTGNAPSVNLTFNGNITYSGANSAIRLTTTTGLYSGTVLVNGGAIVVTGGTAVSISNMTGNASFNNVSGSTAVNAGAVTGVNLGTGADGTYIFGAGFDINSASGTAFTSSANAAKITYNGDITQGSNALMVSFSSLAATGNATFQTGTLSATNGTGILLANVDGPVSFNGTTTLNGGDAGIDVSAGADATNGSQGTIVFAASSSITNPTGALIDIQGSAANFTYSGTFTKNVAAATAFNIANNKANLVVNINGASTPKTISTTTADAIVVSGNIAPASITFAGGNLSVTTTTGRGVNGSGAGTLAFTGATNNITSGNTALLINGLSFGASTINNVTSTAGVNGISLTNASGSLTINAGALTGGAGATFLVSGGTVAVTMGATISQGTATHPAVSISGGHNTGAINFNANVTVTNGTGLQFDNADGTYNFNATNSLNGGDSGVDILNGSGGNFSFSANTSVTNPTLGATAFNVSGSAPASLTMAGPITGNNGRLVSISNAAAAGCGSQTYSNTISGSGANALGVIVNNCNAGTINFSGATFTLGTQGANQALTLTGNAGAAINFSGGNMTLTSVNGHAIHATGGGTIGITGDDNTINTTGSGSAINWAMLTGTHSAGTLRFETINKSGSGSKGVVVNYHDGSFTVTGDDNGDNNPDSITAGGTITGTSARGMEFVDVDGAVSLAGMTFTNATTADGTAPGDCGNAFQTAGNKNCNAPIYFDTLTGGATLRTIMVNGSAQTGIIGYDVTGLTMNTVTVQNGGSDGAENGGAAFKNLRGTVSVSNSLFSNGTRAQFDITNNSGTTLGNVSFLNNEFTGNRIIAAVNSSAQGLLISNQGTMGTVSIGDGTVGNANDFHDTFSNGIQYGGTAGGSSATLNINRNNFTNTNSGVVLQVAGVGVASTLDYTVENNTLVAGALSTSGGIITSATQGHVLDGIIRSNTIGTSGVPNSGAVCNSCNGITVDHDGFGRHDVQIIGNTVQRVKSIGIYYQVADASGNIVITGNLVREPEGNPSNGIYVQSGTQATDNGCIAVTLGGTANNGFPTTTPSSMNSVQGAWDPASFQSEIFVWRRFATTLNLPGLAGGEVAWIAARNNIPDATGPDITVSGTPFGSAASCP
jgi:Putative Ig domain/Bacterial Ig domain